MRWVPYLVLLGFLGSGPALASPDEAVEWQQVEEVTPAPTGSGPSYMLERVVLNGNRKTLDSVIMRYIPLKVGQHFSADDEVIEAARYRLLALGLFSEVDIELRKGHARGHAILVVRVKERNTIVVRDLSFGLTRIAPDWDNVVPFGSIGLEESSLLGTGVQLGGGVAASKDQIAYRLYLADDHFLNTRMGLHMEGLFAEAREYFGDHYLPGLDEDTTLGHYEVMDYRRAGIRVGTGYNLLLDYFFWFDYRFENILAEEPRTLEGSATPDPETHEPVAVGFLEPDHSLLSSFMFGFRRDTTNHPVLPYDGSETSLSVELSNPIIGSDYNYTKFVLGHRTHIPFGREGQSICLGGTAGLITGNAPFFEQFFVGDFSSLAPDRKLGLNFSNLHPQMLDTSISEMWYEDLVLSLNAEYAIPFYRGSGIIYGINGFLRFGVYSLTSTHKIDDAGVPIDLTLDFGIRIDTTVGVFSLSFANVLQLIPPIRQETTE